MMAEKDKTFHKPNLLVVEGVDEERLLFSILDHLNISTIQVRRIDGVTELGPQLKLFKKTEGFSNVKRLAVLMDSDDSPDNRQESIRAHLKNAGLPCPETSNKFAEGSPRVIYSTVPSPNHAGCLEDLINQTFSDHHNAVHVTNFLSNVGLTAIPRSSRWSKSWLHSLLSTMESPGLKIGEATKAKYIDIGHAEFGVLRNFITQFVA
jgi:hypothetical protein